MVIEMVLAPADFAKVRFAHSPMRELIASIRTLQDPKRRHTYQRWLSTIDARLDHVDMKLLRELSPVGPFVFSFLMPTPVVPWAALPQELLAVSTTPDATVRSEIEHLTQGKHIPEPLRPLYEDPAGQLPYVVQEMDKYWQAVIQPVWQRLLGVVTADLFHRLEHFANGGLAKVLEQLHPEISLEHDRLQINKPHHCSHRYDMTGSGIILVPCAFSWPALVVDCCDTNQPSLTYPPRGAAKPWIESSPDEADPLSALVGRTRATLLATLALPNTTTQLAKQLDLSPAAISQHLKVLKASGLADSRRRGRIVLYQRTPVATSLLSPITD